MSDTPQQLPNESDGDYIYRLADHFGIPRYMTKQIRLPEKQSSGWQPIETAPKDGTKVLGYCDAYGNVVVMEWFVYHGCRAVWETVDGESEVEPTHWMPLPNPPTK